MGLEGTTWVTGFDDFNRSVLHVKSRMMYKGICAVSDM